MQDAGGAEQVLLRKRVEGPNGERIPALASVKMEEKMWRKHLPLALVTARLASLDDCTGEFLSQTKTNKQKSREICFELYGVSLKAFHITVLVRKCYQYFVCGQQRMEVSDSKSHRLGDGDLG